MGKKHKIDRPLINAMHLLDDKKYREAASAFAELYNSSNDAVQRQEIFQILEDAYYKRHEEKLKSIYEGNRDLLKEYPYIWGMNFCSYEELHTRLFPCCDGLFYCFSTRQDRFLGEYDASTDGKMRYFFEDLSRPLFIEDEDNFYNLMFLNDNVRVSEDFGEDNHIYLYYSTSELLERLMQADDLSGLLKGQKFVFLIGSENKDRYPVDFKREFGCDYTQCPPRELGVGDIKRIVFGWKIANVSGTSFLADILDFDPNLITIPDCMMYSFVDFYENRLKGKPAVEAIAALKHMPDTDAGKTFITNMVRIKSKSLSKPLLKELNRVTSSVFLEELENILKDISEPTAREWLIGIYLAYSRCHGRNFNGRIYPSLFVYPHDDMFYLAGIARDSVVLYFNTIKEFPYHKAVAVIRDPVTQAGAVIRFMTNGHHAARNERGEIQQDPFYCMAFGTLLPKDYYFPVQNVMRKDIRVVRFEDLKLNPEATLAAIGEFLNIPMTESMFKTTWCGVQRDGVDGGNTAFPGFDPAPVYRSYSEYLSVFDKYRIEMLLQKLMEFYGYDIKYYDGQEFTDQEKFMMMQLPFLCESMPTVLTEQAKLNGRENAMNFIKYDILIKQFPFSVDIDGFVEEYAPLQLLKPKESLLKNPVYTKRV